MTLSKVPSRGKRAGMKFVDDEILERDSRPALIRPVETTPDPRCAKDRVRRAVASGKRIGTFPLAFEDVKIVAAFADVRNRRHELDSSEFEDRVMGIVRGLFSAEYGPPGWSDSAPRPGTPPFHRREPMRQTEVSSFVRSDYSASAWPLALLSTFTSMAMGRCANASEIGRTMSPSR